MLEHIIRQKDLENNFIETMNLLGYPLAEIEIESIRNTKKTNTSNHKDISYYYDEESVQLVADKERFIIEKYSYTTPECY
jgi:hypothetical protein